VVVGPNVVIDDARKYRRKVVLIGAGVSLVVCLIRKGTRLYPNCTSTTMSVVGEACIFS